MSALINKVVYSFHKWGFKLVLEHEIIHQPLSQNIRYYIFCFIRSTQLKVTEIEIGSISNSNSIAIRNSNSKKRTKKYKPSIGAQNQRSTL